jgi:hypothetical protein
MSLSVLGMAERTLELTFISANYSPGDKYTLRIQQDVNTHVARYAHAKKKRLQPTDGSHRRHPGSKHDRTRASKCAAYQVVAPNARTVQQTTLPSIFLSTLLSNTSDWTASLAPSAQNLVDIRQHSEWGIRPKYDAAQTAQFSNPDIPVLLFFSQGWLLRHIVPAFQESMAVLGAMAYLVAANLDALRGDTKETPSALRTRGKAIRGINTAFQNVKEVSTLDNILAVGCVASAVNVSRERLYSKRC